MNVIVVTPARLGSRTGNNITAIRWASILRNLGHTVSIIHDYQGEPADIMIALNAYRSAKSVQNFRRQNPAKKIVVALTGTDIYKFIHSHKEETLNSIKAADRLVVLNDLMYKSLPSDQRQKVCLIYESADPLPKGKRASVRNFNTCVIGHLRPEKDPLRTALATRDLPESSKIRIMHYGRAHTEEWADKARKEEAINQRYKWFGEVAHWRIRQVLAKSRLMVLSSVIEGGPNVLSEAVMAGIPVICTNIDGCLGVLGADYPGYFSVGDTKGLHNLLMRVETDQNFLVELEEHITKLAPRFSRLEEQIRWADLMKVLVEEKSLRKIA
jgi:putative glycosyltransferase (TIGR04348 family)